MWYHRYWLLSKWQKPMCSGVRTPNFDLSTWCNFPQRGVGHGHLEVSNSESFCQRPTFTKWSNMASWHVVSPSRSLGNAIKLNPTDLLKVCGWRGSSSWLETRKKKNTTECTAWQLPRINAPSMGRWAQCDPQIHFSSVVSSLLNNIVNLDHSRSGWKMLNF